MILRRPTFQDIYKASEFISKDEDEKKTTLLAWLEQSKNLSFFSWVIVKDKEVHAVITGWQEDGKAAIGRLEGSSDHQELLLSKMFRTFDLHQVNTTVPEVTPILLKFGFDVETYNVVYKKPVKVVETETVVEAVEDKTEGVEV